MAIIKLEYHPAAANEVVGAKEWYASIDPNVAQKFMLELANAERLVGRSPASWGCVPTRDKRFSLPWVSIRDGLHCTTRENLGSSLGSHSSSTGLLEATYSLKQTSRPWKFNRESSPPNQNSTYRMDMNTQVFLDWSNNCCRKVGVCLKKNGTLVKWTRG